VTEPGNQSHADTEPEPEPDEPDEQPSGERALLDELLAEPVITAAQPRTRVGRLVEWRSGSAPRVDFEGNDRGPLAARSTIALDPTTILEAIQTARAVLLTFEDGRPDAPIITGLLQSFEAFDEDEAAPEIWADNEGDEQPRPAIAEVEARVDGRRVELEAADEIVLRCGEASIVLRRNGRVVIRGTYVETRSRGVNRVKGGSVEIN
jgi:hypothetical protein